MSEVNPQNLTDQERAKAKLDEIQSRKEAQNDPRNALAPRTQPGSRPATDDKSGDIRPVTAKPKKKKFGQKLKEAMFSEDIGNGSVTEYVFFKILVPSVKRILADMANTAINMALGLDPKTRTISANTHQANASNYRDRNYARSGGDIPGYRRRTAVSELEWDEDTAKDIFNQMSDLIDRYGTCSISDAYSIMNMPQMIRTTDNNWGWTSMAHADVVPVDPLRERWIVDLPEARPLR